jgi:glycosyltransferase involved in cell wall biosynthesis
MPKTSVIIPTYNRSGMVREAISSVLAQTERDFEIVVVDDGSTDDTRSVVGAMQNGRISYFYKNNGGPASARNFGLSKAKGEYVAFLDSDDLWPENYLEVMLSQLEGNSEFGAAYSYITVIRSDGGKVESYKRPEGKSGWIASELFMRGSVWPSAAVFRSEVWQDFYFDELIKKSYEDSDAFLRLSMKTKFLFVGNVEAFHRISSDSIAAAAGVACTRLLILERFYYELGGDKIVPAAVARRRLSHACRKVAEERRKSGLRRAAMQLYERAIRYWPYDLRLYLGYLKTLFLRSSKDQEPDWRLPERLGDPIGLNRFG